MSINYLKPTSDGYYHQWNSTLETHYDKLDENITLTSKGSDNGDTDYVYEGLGGTGKRDSFGHDTWSPGTITISDVKVVVDAMRNGNKYWVKTFIRFPISGTPSDYDHASWITDISTTAYGEHSQSHGRPGGGSWSVSDINDLQFGIYSGADGTPGKSDWLRITRCFLEITYSVGATYEAPTSPQCERQTNPTDAFESPIFTAIFNDADTGDTVDRIQIQVSTDDEFGTTEWDSGYVAITGITDGQRCEEVEYGDGASGNTLSSDPAPDGKYYWRCRFKKNSTGEFSAWSAAAEFSGIVRAWAHENAAFRWKLTFDPDHVGVPAGYTAEFLLQTGFYEVIASNGSYNEAVQASGGRQLVKVGTKTHFVWLSRYENNQNLNIWIATYDETTESWGSPTMIVASGTTYDTHYFPAIEADNSGYLHVFFGCHGGSMKYAKSQNPNDSSSWYTGMTIGTSNTYPIGLCIKSTGRLYVFTRGFGDDEYQFYYTDNPTSSNPTWSGAKKFLENNDPDGYRLYMYGLRFDEDIERLHVAWSYIDDDGAEYDNMSMGVWYAYSDYNSSETDGFRYWKDLNGVQRGETTTDPVDRASGIPSIVETTSTNQYFAMEMAFSKDNDPIVIYTDHHFDETPQSPMAFTAARRASYFDSDDIDDNTISYSTAHTSAYEATEDGKHEIGEYDNITTVEVTVRAKLTADESGKTADIHVWLSDEAPYNASSIEGNQTTQIDLVYDEWVDKKLTFSGLTASEKSIKVDFYGTTATTPSTVSVKIHEIRIVHNAFELSEISEDHDVLTYNARCGYPTMTDADGRLVMLTSVLGVRWNHGIPTADGDHTNYSLSSGSDGYALVDDGIERCDEDGSYIYWQNTTGEASFTDSKTLPANCEIIGVEVEALCRLPVGTSATLKLFLRDTSDTDYESANKTCSAYTYDKYFQFRQYWEQNPETTSAWTKATAQAFEFGIKCTQATGTFTLRCSRIIKRYKIQISTDDEAFSGEVIKVVSGDGGATWEIEAVTENTGVGFPIITCKRISSNDQIEFAWVSGNDLIFWREEPFGKILPSCRDLRLYYQKDSNTEIDRILDRCNHNESLIRFAVQDAISAGRIAAGGDYYLYAGDGNAWDDFPDSDPNTVAPRLFSGFEEGDDLDTLEGFDGWDITSGTITLFKYPDNASRHTNKIGGGATSARFAASGAMENVLTETTGINDVYAECLLWMESSGTTIELRVYDNSSNVFGVGFNNSTNYAGYRTNSGWTDDSTLRARQQNYYKVALRVTSSGCSAWFEGTQIADEVTAITSVKKIEIVATSHSYADSVFVLTRQEKRVDTTVTSGFTDATMSYAADHTATYYGSDAKHENSGVKNVFKIDVIIKARRTEIALTPTISLHAWAATGGTYSGANAEANQSGTLELTDVDTWYYKTLTLSGLDPDNGEGEKSIKTDFYAYTVANTFQVELSSIKYYYWECEPCVVIGDLEAHGFSANATILATSKDTFRCNGTIEDYLVERSHDAGVDYRSTILTSRGCGAEFLAQRKIERDLQAAFGVLVESARDMGVMFNAGMIAERDLAAAYERELARDADLQFGFNRAVKSERGSEVGFLARRIRESDLETAFGRIVRSNRDFGVGLSSGFARHFDLAGSFNRQVRAERDFGVGFSGFIRAERDMGIDFRRRVQSNRDMGIGFNVEVIRDSDMETAFLRRVIAERTFDMTLSGWVETLRDCGASFLTRRVIDRSMNVGFGRLVPVERSFAVSPNREVNALRDLAVGIRGEILSARDMGTSFQTWRIIDRGFEVGFIRNVRSFRNMAISPNREVDAVRNMEVAYFGTIIVERFSNLPIAFNGTILSERSSPVMAKGTIEAFRGSEVAFGNELSTIRDLAGSFNRRVISSRDMGPAFLKTVVLDRGMEIGLNSTMLSSRDLAVSGRATILSSRDLAVGFIGSVFAVRSGGMEVAFLTRRVTERDLSHSEGRDVLAVRNVAVGPKVFVLAVRSSAIGISGTITTERGTEIGFGRDLVSFRNMAVSPNLTVLALRDLPVAYLGTDLVEFAGGMEIGILGSVETDRSGAVAFTGPVVSERGMEVAVPGAILVDRSLAGSLRGTILSTRDLAIAFPGWVVSTRDLGIAFDRGLIADRGLDIMPNVIVLSMRDLPVAYLGTNIVEFAGGMEVGISGTIESLRNMTVGYDRKVVTERALDIAIKGGILSMRDLAVAFPGWTEAIRNMGVGTTSGIVTDRGMEVGFNCELEAIRGMDLQTMLEVLSIRNLEVGYGIGRIIEFSGNMEIGHTGRVLVLRDFAITTKGTIEASRNLGPAYSEQLSTERGLSVMFTSTVASFRDLATDYRGMILAMRDLLSGIKGTLQREFSLEVIHYGWTQREFGFEIAFGREVPRFTGTLDVAYMREVSRVFNMPWNIGAAIITGLILKRITAMTPGLEHLTNEMPSIERIMAATSDIARIEMLSAAINRISSVVAKILRQE